MLLQYIILQYCVILCIRIRGETFIGNNITRVMCTGTHPPTKITLVMLFESHLLSKGSCFQKKNPSEKGHGLFYSAGRAIVSRDGQTTQICCPTAQNTQKPTPTKESTKGGGRRRRPPPFVEAAEGRLLCGCWFLCILCCWATYLCCLAIS